MATVGTVNINLRANTGAFNKNMAKAGKRLKKFGASIGGVVSKVAKFGVVAGAAGAAALTALTKKSFDTIDGTAKLSDQLGITTEKLQGLRHAAEITGAGTATLDKSLEKMNKVLGEAEQGIGTGRYALDALGLSLDQFKGKTPDQTFYMFADAISQVKSPAEQAAIATQIFGRAGGKLINTLNLGADGLGKMQKEAEALGIAFNRVDAAKIEAANDAWTRMQAALQGVGNTIAIEVAPFVEAAYQSFVEWAAQGEGLGAKVGGAINWIIDAFGKLLNVIDLVKAAFYTVESGWNTILQGVANGVSIMEGVFLKLGSVIQKAFGIALEAVASSIARIEYEIKRTYVESKRLVGLLSDVEAIRETNKLRQARQARTQELTGAARGAQAGAVQSAAQSQKLIQAGLSGTAGSIFREGAQDAALKAVQSYRRFEQGASASEFEGFIQGINEKAQAAAETIASKSAERIAASTAPSTAPSSAAATPTQAKTAIRGGFSALSLGPGRSEVIQQDQLKQLKDLNKNIKAQTQIVESTQGLA